MDQSGSVEPSRQSRLPTGASLPNRSSRLVVPPSLFSSWAYRVFRPVPGSLPCDPHLLSDFWPVWPCCDWGGDGRVPASPIPSRTGMSSQIRPGMKGVGRTVMVGTKLEEFGAEVLGVMRDVSPGRDMVLVPADRV